MPTTESPKRLHIPDGAGPWSWRTFDTRAEAEGFFVTLQPGHPAPFLVAEPLVSPTGEPLLVNSWVVLYQPIIFS